MLNFITRYFSSLWALVTWPFRVTWRLISRIFPERDFTVMDIKRGNVYAFHQSSFWRFAKFVGKIGLVIWAAWSTYVFYNHRPMLQERTRQLEETRMAHSRHITDMTTFLEKFNSLVKELNSVDDKILNAQKLDQENKDELLKKRLNIWAELDFLKTRLNDTFTDADYVPEFKKLSELSVEYEIIRAENETVHRRNEEIVNTMNEVFEADEQIISAVSKLTSDNIDAHRASIKKISASLANLGLAESVLVARANKLKDNFVGSAFTPLELEKNLDPKYKKLADNIELWSGLGRLNKVLPLGAPVESPRVTSNYGMREHPIDGESKMHKGIDFAGQTGTPLLAVAPGRVISAGERSGYGKTVEIDHGLGFTTLYAHLSKINVGRGDWVRPGTVVGLGGNSGKSTGPHLHYEIRYNGAHFNPAAWVKGE